MYYMLYKIIVILAYSSTTSIQYYCTLSYHYFLINVSTLSTLHKIRFQLLAAVYMILTPNLLQCFTFKLLCTLTLTCLHCTQRPTSELDHLKVIIPPFVFRTLHSSPLNSYSFLLVSYIGPFPSEWLPFCDEFTIVSSGPLY